jgi:hypothetical protein
MSPERRVGIHVRRARDPPHQVAHLIERPICDLRLDVSAVLPRCGSEADYLSTEWRRSSRWWRTGWRALIAG